MNKLNTGSVSLAVTPTVISTFFSHYLNRKPLKERPTAHLSYDEGLHLVRAFLEFASHHTVDELQAFTAQWVPHPQWVKVDDVKISDAYLSKAAELLHKQLGPDGVKQVGGSQWWQWRKPKSPLEAEWIEMRSHAAERKRTKDRGKRVMLYVHGGAYFFGSVDEHRYQMQRHARKLKARVFAPRYRLAPQFPFPCGIQDCLAAYLHLLSVQEPSEIILAGDSAGGGMVISMLCVLRDQGVPLPAGGILISPWADLTHSFPSVGDPSPLDYIPQYGFHHKPSLSWPPPNDDDVLMISNEVRKKKEGQRSKPAGTSELEEKQQKPVAEKPAEEITDPAATEAVSGGIVTDTGKFLSVTIDGKLVEIKDQIQMYTTNNLLAHPLVSPVMQPSLGGLPPLLVMVGGGEMLRDEQIYLAHKCADPVRYAPPPDKLDEKGRALLEKYKPTDVQLQVWDDLCHVAPTLSFTRPAKYMYRSVAQFGAWALARAQHTGIDIMDDDDISVISSSGSSDSSDSSDSSESSKSKGPAPQKEPLSERDLAPGQVGKAGDPLPPFNNHMIRQKVTRHGVTHPLAVDSELPGCSIDPKEVCVLKEGQVKKWLNAKQQWDTKFASTKAKVHKKMIEDMAVGYRIVGAGENPPPTALVGRQRIDKEIEVKGRVKSIGLALWSLWGSKHDELTVQRERKAEQAEQAPEVASVTAREGQGAWSFSEIENQSPLPSPGLPSPGAESHRSRRRTVVDENQTGDGAVDRNTPVAQLIKERKDIESLSGDHLDVPGAGKRPHINGIALPFSLNKEAETASMVTLNSAVSPPTGSRPMSPFSSEAGVDHKSDIPTPKSEVERPGLASFETAREDLSMASPASDKTTKANGTR